MENSATRIKVMFVITKSNFGGAQRYVHDLVTHLPVEKYDTTVIFGGHGMLEKKLQEKNIRTLSIATLDRNVNPLLDLRTLRTLISLFKNEKPDIIHLNSSKIGALGALAGRIVGIKKIVFTGHGWAFNENRNIISKIFISAIHWFTVLLSHKTIAVSNKTKEDIARFPFTHNKIVCIRNGIDEELYLEKNNAREKLVSLYPVLAHTRNKLWIGTASELHKNKGIDFMIRALAEIKADVAFIVMGAGEEKNNFINLARRYGISESVFFLDFVPNAKEFIKSFDIYTLTSRTEALPYAILEAGSASLPIIASNVGGIPEIIENNKTGILVAVGNTESTIHALNTLIQDESLRHKLGLGLQKKVGHDFTLKRMVWETEMIYTL